MAVAVAAAHVHADVGDNGEPQPKPVQPNDDASMPVAGTASLRSMIRAVDCSLSCVEQLQETTPRARAQKPLPWAL